MAGVSALAVVALALAAPKDPAASGGSIVLYVGEQRVVTVGCDLQRVSVDATPVGGLQRVAVGDASIADVKTIGHNQILFIGAAQGKTTILAWCSNGQRVSWLIEVRPGQRPPVGDMKVPVKQQLRDATVVDGDGTRDTTVTIVELPGDLRDVTQVISADGGLSFVGYDSADRRVTITAVPYRPRGRPDAGRAPDAGSSRDGGR